MPTPNADRLIEAKLREAVGKGDFIPVRNSYVLPDPLVRNYRAEIENALSPDGGGVLVLDMSQMYGWLYVIITHLPARKQSLGPTYGVWVVHRDPTDRYSSVELEEFVPDGPLDSPTPPYNRIKELALQKAKFYMRDRRATEARKLPKADVEVTHHGSISLFLPNTKAAKAWIEDNVSDDAQWHGNALAVEARYVDDLWSGMEASGLEVVSPARGGY